MKQHIVSMPRILVVRRGLWPFVRPKLWVMTHDFDRTEQEGCESVSFGHMMFETSSWEEAADVLAKEMKRVAVIVAKGWAQQPPINYALS